MISTDTKERDVSGWFKVEAHGHFPDMVDWCENHNHYSEELPINKDGFLNRGTKTSTVGRFANSTWDDITSYSAIWYFEKEEDAVCFILRWGGRLL